jgi:hypothetical protein
MPWATDMSHKSTSPEACANAAAELTLAAFSRSSVCGRCAVGWEEMPPNILEKIYNGLLGSSPGESGAPRPGRHDLASSVSSRDGTRPALLL